MNKVQEYLNKKWLERQTVLGARINLKDEAFYIGVSPTTYSSWTNGYSMPTGDNLRRIRNRYGDEIYFLVGQEPPTDGDSLNSLPPRLADAAREIRETLVEYKISGDSPEAGRLTVEIMKKHGYNLMDTNESDSAK